MAVVGSWTGQRASALQVAMRLTNEAFAGHLGVAVRTVCKWRDQPGLIQTAQMQAILDTALARADDGARARFVNLLDTADRRSTAPSDSLIGLTSHKFLPTYLGPAQVAAVGETIYAQECQLEWSACWRAEVPHPRGICTVNGLPWGVVLHHVEEELDAPTLASVARWRRDSYAIESDWCLDHFRGLLGCDTAPEYVLSLYWLRTSIWQREELASAMRLLCAPRVLIDNEPTDMPDVADLTEPSLIRDGFDDPRIVGFGLGGVSLGFASWAGVSYASLAPQRALTPEHLVSLEVIVQALWCYCHQIRSQIESGGDPVVPDGFGWRWLRAMRSRLSGARPTESAQHASMRAAILETSELLDQINATLEVVRDAALEGKR